ncbi:hypothetical protein AC249_AIPGENE27571 [Exaiptasia diaphana]|nr:hypothetical protein AC249_AIPGENE27571 [Exaiptasia diaphana]
MMQEDPEQWMKEKEEENEILLRRVGELEKTLHRERNASQHLRTIADLNGTISGLRADLSKALVKVSELEKNIERIVHEEHIKRKDCLKVIETQKEEILDWKNEFLKANSVSLEPEVKKKKKSDPLEASSTTTVTKYNVDLAVVRCGHSNILTESRSLQLSSGWKLTMEECDYPSDIDYVRKSEPSAKAQSSRNVQEDTFDILGDNSQSPNRKKRLREETSDDKEAVEKRKKLPKNVDQSTPKEESCADKPKTEFVAVCYTSKKPGCSTFYLGQIVDREDQLVSVNFLQKVKGGRGYIWPKKIEKEDVYDHQIFASGLTARVEENIFSFDEGAFQEAFEECCQNLIKIERKMKIESVWEETGTPYWKIGPVSWKDFKTLQLDMLEVQETQMKITLGMSESGWEVGYVIDEVIDEYMKILEKMAQKRVDIDD